MWSPVSSDSVDSQNGRRPASAGRFWSSFRPQMPDSFGMPSLAPPSDHIQPQPAHRAAACSQRANPQAHTAKRRFDVQPLCRRWWSHRHASTRVESPCGRSTRRRFHDEITVLLYEAIGPVTPDDEHNGARGRRVLVAETGNARSLSSPGRRSDLRRWQRTPSCEWKDCSCLPSRGWCCHRGGSWCGTSRPESGPRRFAR